MIFPIQEKFQEKPWQKQALIKAERFNILIAHRGSGKSFLALHILIGSALAKPGTYYYFCPLQTQVRKHVWDALLPEIDMTGLTPYPGYLRIDVANGSKIYFEGVDSIKGKKGMHIDGAILDEAQDLDARDYGDTLRPTLEIKKGFLWLIGTRRANSFFEELYQNQEFKAGRSLVSIYDSGDFNDTQIESLRKEMVTIGLLNSFQTEYECRAIEDSACSINIQHLAFNYPGNPEPGKEYVVGADIARDADFTALSVFEKGTNRMVWLEKMQGDLALQKQNIARVAKTWNDALVVIDNTNNKALADELEAMTQKVRVERFQYSSKSKGELFQKLIAFISQSYVSLLENQDLREEFRKFRIKYYKDKIVYEGFPHDDIVNSIALAIWKLKPQSQQALKAIIYENGRPVSVSYEALRLAQRIRADNNE